MIWPRYRQTATRYCPSCRALTNLRANVSAYYATYIALAEQLDCPLVTADRRLGSALGPRCRITLIGT